MERHCAFGPIIWFTPKMITVSRGSYKTHNIGSSINKLHGTLPALYDRCIHQLIVISWSEKHWPFRSRTLVDLFVCFILNYYWKLESLLWKQLPFKKISNFILAVNIWLCKELINITKTLHHFLTHTSTKGSRNGGKKCIVTKIVSHITRAINLLP